MSKIYQNDIGTEIICDCGTDISLATNQKLLVWKPHAEEVEEWTAEIRTIDDLTNYLIHVAEDGDLDTVGTYKIQPSLTLGTWSGEGDTGSFVVYAPFK